MVLYALALLVVLGFGALAVDLSYMRMARSRAQDIADASSQAAMLILRRTGSVAEATAVAERVAAMNTIAGEPGSVEQMVFGTWDQPGGQPGAFTTDGQRLNAVRVRVRQDSAGLPFLLGRLFGWETFDAEAWATSAMRNLHVVLVLDITNSWSPSDFVYAREAAVVFLDTMRTSYGPRDKIGMTVFTNRYAWELTPMADLTADFDVAAVRSQWESMKTASKAGVGAWPWGCAVHSGGATDDFTNPEGGCYPNMPREYSDEPGTDHTTGMDLAWQMFSEEPDTSAVRVMVVLTDGKPASIGSSSGAIRAAAGYQETRWREYVGPAPHSSSDIRWDSIEMTHDMWDDLRVHTFVVSFVADDWFMHEMPTGQGYYVRTSDAESLVPILHDIANSLPLALVE